MDDDYKEILALWGLKLKSIRSDLKTTGSPDRYLKSAVVQETKGKIYILEKIGFFDCKRREYISNALITLHENGIEEITPYIKNVKGEYITEYKLRSWQLREYVKGDKLDRKNYFEDEWRGIEAARFLIKMKTLSGLIENNRDNKPLIEYIKELNERIKNKKNLDVLNIIDFIEKNYVSIETSLIKCFVHGDYHPLNIIWGKNKIECVIDWEFAGYRDELYDAANLIGCIGSENPELIFKGMASSFFKELKTSILFNKESFEYMPELLIALRYAGWLSLWLRAGDEPMVYREIEYIKWLIDNYQKLKKYFSIK